MTNDSDVDTEDNALLGPQCDCIEAKNLPKQSALWTSIKKTYTSRNTWVKMSDHTSNDQRDSGDKPLLEELHFRALSTGFNNNKQLDDTQQLLAQSQKHKFIVSPVKLPNSTTEFNSEATDGSSEPSSQKSLGFPSVASSPAGFSVPAIVTPTKPSK